MSECERVRALLALRAEDRSEDERRRAERHLAECEGCRAAARAYAEQDRRIQALPCAGLTAEQRRRVLAQVREGEGRGGRFRLRPALGTAAALVVIALLALGLGGLFEQGLSGEQVGQISTEMPGAPAVSPPGPSVAELLASPPAPGESVEVDAYFSGKGAVPMRSGPPGQPGEVFCPTNMRWQVALTDRPFPAGIQVLNMTMGNLLPEGTAWLAAASPEGLAPNKMIVPDLPYYARLRGHLGDPALAACPNADRIFVVEEVTAVYEREPPGSVGRWELPADYASWPRYSDDDLGYSLPYPPDWAVGPEPIATVAQGLMSNVALRSPRWPDHPVEVQVQAGETHYDPYDPSSLPPVLEGESFGVFEQGWAFEGLPATRNQHLAGHVVERAEGTEKRTVTVVFSANGYTYLLRLTFPLGFDAPQPLLTAFSAMVEGFRLDHTPGPTPTPPIRETLGAGPFLTKEEALARVTGGTEVALLEAALVPEGEARRMSDVCSTFLGHPEGVWVLWVQGTFEEAARTMRFFVDATSGESLCGEELLPGTYSTPPPPLPTAAPTPTLDPGEMEETWLSRSPDGQWIAQGDAVYLEAEGEAGTYYTRFIVRHADGSVEWTVADGWAPLNLGYTTPRPLHWSADGRYLYWTNRPVPDGCQVFTNGWDLQRLDLSDGSVTEMAPGVGLWLALSPDEKTLAYASYGAEGLILRDLATGQEQRIALGLPGDFPAAMSLGHILWEPGGERLVLAAVRDWCEPGRSGAILRVDVASGTAVVLAGFDDRVLRPVEWLDGGQVRVVAGDGREWVMDVETGEIVKPEA